MIPAGKPISAPMMTDSPASSIVIGIRCAIVSDTEWLEDSVKVFGWLIPGEIKVFDADEVHTKWLVALDEDDD